MRLSSIALAWALLPAGLAAAGEPVVPMCERWNTEYADDGGSHVIALWQFDAGNETLDASGGGHQLLLENAEVSPDGRFGAGLESFCGWPVQDERHRARAKSTPELSPKGPFTLEMWIRPKEELDADYPSAFLLDKKYVDHNDYQLILGKADRYGSRVVSACLGFGTDSSTYHSRPLKLVPGTWVHLAFTYDGAGTGRFFVDGRPWGHERFDGRKGVSAGSRFLSIGDRVGSLYHGFPGIIDEARICDGALEFRRVAFECTPTRACFVRNESAQTLPVKVTNLDQEPLRRATVTVSIDGSETMEQTVENLKPGASVAIDYPLNLGLRPDAYRVAVQLAVEGPGAYVSEDSIPIRIVPRRPPHQFPVLMWGVGSPSGVLREMDRLQEIGFTHVLGFRADYEKIFSAGRVTDAADPDTVAETRRMLDEALAQNMTIVASLSPGAAMRSHEKLRRVDRDGNPLAKEDVCGLLPRLNELCYHVGASVASSYGDHPAFGAAMLHTEVRGHAAPCFHEEDQAAFRAHAGIDVPPEAGHPRGVDYTRLPDFPADRVIPDDHPLYVYYRWYWKTGDGWNGLNTQLDRGLKSTGRDDLWTYHDPAVRVASVYGSGGGVDFVSQWTYSYPDPIRIGLAADELLAMAAGSSRRQQMMKMTQIIWYRSQTAPEPASPQAALPYRARWELQQPGAPFITVAPMHLREAFWTKMARPVRGIMYHGWQSLVPCDSQSGYRFTHPETQHELARLIRQVVRPLGPTLLQVPGAGTDVAMLESFASEMFARRGTYGWNRTWAGDAYHVLSYAHLRPEIVFDETIVDGGLDGFRVLVMPDCDVITERMAERIRQFQAAGGIIVGDERLAPAVTPNVRLNVYERTGRADEDKAALVRLAAELRAQLDGRYRRDVDTSNPEVIPYRRRAGESDYLFLVNDRREFGRYVGHHGRVMENGLPSTAVVSIERGKGVVYDLLAHRPVPTRSEDGRLTFDVQLGPCDGAIYLVTTRAIDAVRIAAPAELARGSRSTCVIEVVDGNGRPVDAVVPLEVAIRDAEGRTAEFSGHYGAADGTVEIPLDVAVNDAFGAWRIEVRELASGRSAVHDLRVLGPDNWPPQ